MTNVWPSIFLWENALVKSSLLIRLTALVDGEGFAGVSDDEFVLSPHAARLIAMMPTMPSKQVFVNFLVILWSPLRRFDLCSEKYTRSLRQDITTGLEE